MFNENLNKSLFIIAFWVINGLFVFGCKKDSDNNFTFSQTKKITTPFGPEDILWDNLSGRNRLLVSCDQRRPSLPPSSEIVTVDLNSDEYSVLIRENEPVSLDFNPHGFYLITRNGKDWLYVINHYKNGSNINSVLIYEVFENNLVFNREYKSDLMISPNEICALKDGSFYFSNDKGGDNLILENLFNKYGGSLVYCNEKGDCNFADKNLAFPNGIEYRDGFLYLATTRNHALFRYSVAKDGTLSNKTKINKINGMDNLRWAGRELIVAVHPRELDFIAHSLDSKAKSPTMIYLIDPLSGKSRLIFEDNGVKISGGSTAIIIENKMYISQVFENYILKVE